MAFNITPPISIDHLIGTWLNGIIKSEKVNIRVGVCALIWTIWHVRNELIFNKSNFPSFLQVIPLAIHWIHMSQSITSSPSRVTISRRTPCIDGRWGPILTIMRSFRVGLFSGRRSSARTWILGATVWQWLFEIFTANSGGGLIEDWHVEFTPRWLIHVSTLSDMWTIKCGFSNNFNKESYALIDVEARDGPFLKKNLMRPMMTHKYRGCIILLSINKSVEPNEEQNVLTSSFDQGFTVNTRKQVFRGIW
jgi:hypothetical protein